MRKIKLGRNGPDVSAMGLGCMGMSISYDIIVKKHCGRLEVRSRLGEGTCFRIVLPIAYVNAGAQA